MLSIEKKTLNEALCLHHEGHKQCIEILRLTSKLRFSLRSKAVILFSSRDLCVLAAISPPLRRCSSRPLLLTPSHRCSNVISGDCKSLSNGKKPVQFQAAFSIQSAPQEYGGHLELGFGQPAVICSKYAYGDQYYGVVSVYGPQIAGSCSLSNFWCCALDWYRNQFLIKKQKSKKKKT